MQQQEQQQQQQSISAPPQPPRFMLNGENMQSSQASKAPFPKVSYERQQELWKELEEYPNNFW
jgi:hypothetical protein